MEAAALAAWTTPVITTAWTAIQRWVLVEDAPILTVPCNENNGDFFNQGLVPLAEAKAPDF